MTDFWTYLIFWIIFVVVFMLSFRILQAVEIEKYFKKYRQAEIYAAYFLICSLSAFLFGYFVLYVISLWPGN